MNRNLISPAFAAAALARFGAGAARIPGIRATAPLFGTEARVEARAVTLNDDTGPRTVTFNDGTDPRDPSEINDQ